MRPADQSKPQYVARVEQIEADADRDRWFTAAEALEYGFIDRVISREAQAGNSRSE